MSIWRAFWLAFSLVGTRFGGSAISFISQIILARLLTPGDVGIVFMGMSAAAFISLIASGGYPHLAITALPRYYALGRKRLLNAFYAAFLRDGLVIALVTFGVACIVYFWFPLGDDIKTALLFGCLSVPASVFIRMNAAIANATRRYNLSYVPDYLLRPGLFLLFLAVCWVFHIPVSTLEVLWAFIIANSLIAVWQAWLIGHEGFLSGLKRTSHHRLSPYLRNRALSLVIVGVVATAFSDLVTLTAGVFLPAEEVAVVGVCIKLAALAGFITQSVQQFALPDLTRAMAAGERLKERHIILRINSITLGTLFCGILVAVFFGQYILQIYGKSYESGHWLLVLFLVGQFIRAAGGMNQYLLSLAGYQIKTAWACLVALILLVSFIGLLSPFYGVYGVAIAAIVADIAWAILLAAQAGRLLAKRGDIFGLRNKTI